MLFLFVMYPIYFFESTPSTNLLAKKLAKEGALHGTAVIAANQTEGRGRLGKSWYSAAGKGLYCSIIVRPDVSIENYPKITLVAGLSVALVLDRITACCTQLKWPNDIYLSEKKVAGILTESSALHGSFSERYAVVGIGINVNHCTADFPFELRDIVNSIFVETGAEFVVRDLFHEIRQELLHQLQLFSDEGFTPLLAQWRKKDFLLGKEMECVNTEGKKIRGIAQGPDSAGQLHVLDTFGRMHEVLSGDVRLATS
jgi:BirA family transcriptional regulator, biotin operon repressor / biotin---[acetyl-CoA-carboxylase] ligase